MYFSELHFDFVSAILLTEKYQIKFFCMIILKILNIQFASFVHCVIKHVVERFDDVKASTRQHNLS